MKTAIMIMMAGIILFAGCRNYCTNKYCADQSMLRQIEFKNFSENEIDTFLISRFVKNSGFINRTDSFYVYADKYNSNMTIEPKWVTLPSEINVSVNDFEVKILGTQTTYKGSDFMITKQACNTCTHGKDEYYNHCDSYKINSSTITDWRFVISK